MYFRFAGVRISRRGAFDYGATLWFYTEPVGSHGRITSPPQTTAVGACQYVMDQFYKLCAAQRAEAVRILDAERSATAEVVADVDDDSVPF